MIAYEHIHGARRCEIMVINLCGTLTGLRETFLISISLARFAPSRRKSCPRKLVSQFIVHILTAVPRLRPSAPPALSRGFNKSRGSFSSYPAAAETHGIKEISAAPVNLGLRCGAASWESRPACRYSTALRIPSEATTRFALSSALPREEARVLSFPDVRSMERLVSIMPMWRHFYILMDALCIPLLSLLANTEKKWYD
jgi:hypothetical protein